MEQDSGDYTYPTPALVPVQPAPCDALRMFDLRTAPEILHQEVSALREELTDIIMGRMEINQRLAHLESCTHLLLNLENERMLKLEEAVVALQRTVSMLLDQRIEQLCQANRVLP